MCCPNGSVYDQSVCVSLDEKNVVSTKFLNMIYICLIRFVLIIYMILIYKSITRCGFSTA